MNCGSTGSDGSIETPGLRSKHPSLPSAAENAKPPLGPAHPESPTEPA